MSPEQNPMTSTNVGKKSITQAEWDYLNNAGNNSSEDSQAARNLAADLAGTEEKRPDGRKSTIITIMNENGKLEEKSVLELAKDYLSDFPEVINSLNEQERALREGNDWRMPK